MIHRFMAWEVPPWHRLMWKCRNCGVITFDSREAIWLEGRKCFG